MKHTNHAHLAANGVTKTRILVVDDHPVMRDGLTGLINRENDMIVCGGASDCAEAIEALKTSQPDLMIIDLMLGGSARGIELIKDVKARTRSIPVLVFSMHEEGDYAERVLHAGAGGYISKQAVPERILEAIRKVARGEISLSNEMAATVLKKFAGGRVAHAGEEVEQLSDRELEVFELLGHGKSTQDIAGELSLSVKTVETYRTRLKEKLALGNAREVLQRAVQWVLSDER